MSSSNEARSLLSYVGVAAMLVAAISMQDAIAPSEVSPDVIERYLRRELEARVGAVLEWESARRSAVEAIADAPIVRGELAKLPAGRSAERDRRLAAVCGDLEGCVLARPDGAVIAAHGAADVPDNVIEAAARGRTVHSRLVPSDGEARYAVFFATPIVDEGEVRAVLAGRVHPHEELGAILGAHPPGRTGETYAVDPRGYMVTRSRFRVGAERRRVERLLRAPIATRATRAPVASIASAQRTGTDVDGYLDYRGVRVVGAWRWIEELGASVITEMDASEAYSTLALR